MIPGATGWSAPLRSLGKSWSESSWDISGQEKEEKVHGCTKGKSCLSNLIAFWIKRIRLGGEGRAVDAIYLTTFQCFLLQYPRVSLGWDKIRMSGTNNG